MHRLLFLLIALSTIAGAQVPRATHAQSGATVTGVVQDSISGGGLAEATVQLIGAEPGSQFVRTAVTDMLGRFTLDSVPVGHYRLGFFHPILDSLGAEAPLRDVYVNTDRPLRADLSVPSPARLNAAICGPRAVADSSGLIMGSVRSARNSEPDSGVAVTAEWLEYSIGIHGLSQNHRRIRATTAGNGWFAMCNVPNTGTVALLATHGTDSTDVIEIQMPSNHFVRREIFIGATRTVTVAGATRPGDTAAAPSRRVHVGDGRLSGTVVTVAGEKPVANAQVSIIDGPQTRTNERGEFTLVDAPAGTRMLEVRALGYYPTRIHVDVVAGAPPVLVALPTLRAVLDTVKIVASRLSSPDAGGFDRRKRMGVGHFLTPDDVARFSPIVTSDLFRLVPGMSIQLDSTGEKLIKLKGSFEAWCDPSIFINDHNMSFLTLDQLDTWVHPGEVKGIEIYRENTVPAQFQVGLNGCGSIAIWTK